MSSLSVLIIVLCLGIVIGATLLTPVVGSEHSSRLAALWPAVMTFWAIVVLVEVVAVRAGTDLGRSGHWLSLSSAALAALPVALFPRGRRWVALGIVLLATLLGLANVAFLRRFGSPLPIELATRVADAWRVRGAVFESFEVSDAALLAPLLALGIAGLLGGRPPARREHAAAALCAVAALPVLFHASSVAKRPPELAPAPAHAARDGFVAMHLGQAARRAWLGVHAGRLDSATRARIDRFARSRAGSRPVRHAGVARGANLVLIQVESLNSWVVGLELGGIEVAPTLNALARRGLFFPHVLDQTAGGRSSDADHLVLVSQHPLPEAPIAVVAAENEVVALPGVLGRAGYRSVLVAAEPRGLWGASRRALRYGFDDALFAEDLGNGRRFAGAVTDRVVFQSAAELVAELRRPSFLRISTFSTHSPYEPLPRDVDEIDLGELEGTPLGNYLDAVRYFDSALRDFVERLAPNTLLVIHGDHTETFGFDRQELARLTRVDAPGPTSDLSLQFVPLVVVHPELETAERIEHAAGLIDVAPTILSLLGLERPASFFGTPLQEAGASLAARWDGLVLGSPTWTGRVCSDWPRSSVRPVAECDAIRAAAREELEVSWLVTRHNLGAELANGTL